MSSKQPLYNSRITKIYLQYLLKYYPSLSVDGILAEAEIANYEIEDPAHWFSQEQVDRFHDIVAQRTGEPKISREVGRYAASSDGLGAAKQYILGLMSPTAVYLSLEKIYPLMSRAAIISAKKIGRNKVEIVSIPKPGVTEKRYQCDNRLGTLESLAAWFTGKFARIEHPSCLHQGDTCCRYIVSWEEVSTHIWKRIRNYSVILGIAAAIGFALVLPLEAWLTVTLTSALITAVLAYYSELLEKRMLAKTVGTQKEAAKDSLIESDVRYSNALLVQEIGQATLKILDIDRLLTTVASVMEKRLDFDRGMIMLADREKRRLHYSAGYGHTPAQEELMQQTEFNLDNPESKGVFVLAFREQKPFLINDIGEIVDRISHKSLEFARRMGSQSLICVPIFYERESLGILTVDNHRSKHPLRQSDLSLLMGVASLLAISIVNAMSFKKLQESEKKYRELIENANSIILRIDPKGRIIFFNEFAQKSFGYTEEEILGKDAKHIVLSGDNPSQTAFEHLIEVLHSDSDKPVVQEIETARRNGEQVWITWTYKPIFADEGRIKEILCIGNDVTDLKRSSLEKKDLEAQLQRAQKMEAIGTLAGGVAHDLNNILSGIVSYPELLLMDLQSDSPLREPILTIQKSGEKAAAIVQDLLTLARRGVATTEVVNLNDIVSEYLVSPEYAKLRYNHPDVTLTKQLDPNLLNIIGSPIHLSKTVMNLVSNAAEAMPDAGQMRIITENRHVEQLQDAYDEIAQGDYAALVITDTGIGIPPQDIDRIFEPFYTKKAMGRSGTGLGMAVVWGTVKDHNGFIDIKSTEGQGTEVTLYFPVTRRESVREEDIVSVKDFMGNGESILVVDDVKEQREIASNILKRLGYSVDTASSGEAALDYLCNNRVDLIVLDMIMDPGMDGLETYRKILEMHPRQRTIIASGYSESVRVKEAQKLGAGAYIKKPYLLEKFSRAVRHELNRC